MLLNNVDFISSDSNLANGCTHFAPLRKRTDGQVAN